MTEQMGPCGPTSVALHAFIVIVNALQAIGIAYIVQRAARKNREDANGKRHSRH